MLSELKFKDSCSRPDIFSCDFNYKAVDCIFDSLEKMAEELDEIKKRLDGK